MRVRTVESKSGELLFCQGIPHTTIRANLIVEIEMIRIKRRRTMNNDLQNESAAIKSGLAVIWVMLGIIVVCTGALLWLMR